MASAISQQFVIIYSNADTGATQFNVTIYHQINPRPAVVPYLSIVHDHKTDTASAVLGAPDKGFGYEVAQVTKGLITRSTEVTQPTKNVNTRPSYEYIDRAIALIISETDKGNRMHTIFTSRFYIRDLRSGKFVTFQF